MKFTEMGLENGKTLMLLPGTACDYQTNFAAVLDPLGKKYHLLCVNYDGFDGSDTIFPDMITVTEKIEKYVKEKHGGRLDGAIGSSLGSSFLGQLIQRENIHIDHGIFGSPDLDQSGKLSAWLQSKLVVPLLTGFTKNEKKKAKTREKLKSFFEMNDETADRFLDCFAKFNPESIKNEYYTDLLTWLREDIHVEHTRVHFIYANKMGERYLKRYRKYFRDPDIRDFEMQHEQWLFGGEQYKGPVLKAIDEFMEMPTDHTPASGGLCCDSDKSEKADVLKYHIEKNTVQETLVIPLFGRLICSEHFPELFSDPEAKRICDSLDYDFADKRRKMESAAGLFGDLEVAQRQYDLRCEVEDYLREHPKAAVVNLGCGLDDTFSKVDNGECRGYNIDFPDVIKVRNDLLPAGERETNLACDLNDFSWMEKIDASGGAVFFAAGVFYYFRISDVKKLFRATAEHFPGGVLAFDSCNERGAKLMRKTWLKEAGITDVRAFFSLEDESELKEWSEHFASVTARSYMRGYRDIYRHVGKFHKLMIRFCDGLVRMKIVKIVFGG